jgi:hypothetical protein
MASQVVQMDYGVVTNVSKGFANASSMLTMVGKVLTIAINILRATALLSLGTSAALARYLENIRQKVEKLAAVCSEFSGDLARAVQDHQKGDIQGKRYFGEGVRG